MNILLITPVWGLLGGMERYLADCIYEFDRMGHRCSIVYGRMTGEAVEDRIETRLKSEHHFKSLSKFESTDDLLEVQRLETILDREKPDVIFMTGVRNFRLLDCLQNYGRLVPMSHDSSLVCMRMTNTTYVRKTICTHKLGPRCLLHGCSVRKDPDSVDGRLIYNSLGRHQKLLQIYRDMGVHLVASNYMKQRLVQHGFLPQLLRVVGYFTNLKPQTANPNDGALPIVSFVGRMNRYKGADYLIRAMAKVSAPFRCTIIGDGEYLPYCKNLAQKLGLSKSVEFLGRRSTEEIAAHLGEISVAVVPSIVPEPFGIVGLEAMMCSKPVVGFDVGGIPDWLRDGKTGFLAPVKDTKSLAQKIEFLLNNPQTAAEMGAAGHRLVTSSFSREKHFERLLSVFETVAANDSRGQFSKAASAASRGLTVLA